MVDPGSMGHRFAHAARWRRLCVGNSHVPRIFHGLRWGWVAEAESSTCCKGQLAFDRRALSLSPEEIVEFFRLDERAAADLNERQFTSLDQHVERGGAD